MQKLIIVSFYVEEGANLPGALTNHFFFIAKGAEGSVSANTISERPITFRANRSAGKWACVVFCFAAESPAFHCHETADQEIVTSLANDLGAKDRVTTRTTTGWRNGV